MPSDEQVGGRLLLFILGTEIVNGDMIDGSTFGGRGYSARAVIYDRASVVPSAGNHFINVVGLDNKRLLLLLTIDRVVTGGCVQ